jgi:hypothetical protein
VATADILTDHEPTVQTERNAGVPDEATTMSPAFPRSIP